MTAINFELLVLTMSEPNHQTQTSETASHVGDCYIWAEIYYLDSVTNYRECLPPHIQEPASDLGDLVMLDEITPSPLWTVLRKLVEKAASIFTRRNSAVRRRLWDSQVIPS